LSSLFFSPSLMCRILCRHIGTVQYDSKRSVKEREREVERVGNKKNIKGGKKGLKERRNVWALERE